MNIIDELYEKVTNIRDNLPNMVIDSLDKYSDLIINLNHQQLEKGLTSSGQLIQPKYASKEYRRYKKATGSKAPLGTPNLKETGAFYNSFYTIKAKDGLITDASDEKTDKLVKKYSSNKNNIMELTDTNLKKVGEFVKQNVYANIEKEIFG